MYGYESSSSFGSSIDTFIDEAKGSVKSWIELWDYRGGAAFRGFVAENNGERNLFVFFDENIINSNLKPG